MRRILALAIVAILLALLTLAGASQGAPDSREIVKASDILDRIEKGEDVQYEDVIVQGDLDLRGLDLPRDESDTMVVNSSIKIENSEIGGTANFDKVRFLKPVDFEGSQFDGDAGFRGTRFDEVANFRAVQFNKNANFEVARFGEHADFMEARFGGHASFIKVRFDGDANFLRSRFSGDARFMYTEFAGRADFSGARIVEYAYFMNTNFSEYAYFWDAQFNGDASFREARFHGDAYFWDVQFDGDARFEEALFEKDADFKFADFDEIAYFMGTHFDGNLKLNDARIYTMRLSNATFDEESEMFLTDSDFSQLYLSWDVIEDHLAYDGSAYLALVKNFKNLEYFREADDCYYRYRRESQSQKSWSDGSKYIDLLAWTSCGYGVRPQYALFLGLFVVMICAVYYWRQDAIRRLKKIEEGEEGDGGSGVTLWDAIYFSVVTFTTLGGYGDWYPLDKHRKVVMFEGIFGWLILSLFLVTLASVMIR